MTIIFVFLQQYLLIHFGIQPVQVGLDTNFRRDLDLSEEAIEGLLATVSSLTGIALPTDSACYLTDVFDLLMYVLLRSKEAEVTSNFSAFSNGAKPSRDWFLDLQLEMPFLMQTHLN